MYIYIYKIKSDFKRVREFCYYDNRGDKRLNEQISMVCEFNYMSLDWYRILDIKT